MSGYDERELLELRIPDLEATESANATISRISGIMERGEDRFESRHRRKDGTTFDVEVSVRYQAAEGGRMVAFLQDISTRKRAEEQLRHNLE
jgi:PAS domain S-box-containing protein